MHVGPPGRAPEREAMPRRPTTLFRRRPRSHGQFCNRNRTRGAFSYFFPPPVGLARGRVHRENSVFKSSFLSPFTVARTRRGERIFVGTAPRARRPAAPFFCFYCSSTPFTTNFMFSHLFAEAPKPRFGETTVEGGIFGADPGGAAKGRHEK